MAFMVRVVSVYFMGLGLRHPSTLWFGWYFHGIYGCGVRVIRVMRWQKKQEKCHCSRHLEVELWF